MTRFAAFAVIASLFCTPALAQMGGGAPAGAAGSAVQSSGAQSLGNHMGQNNMTQDQFNQLSEYVDQARRLSKTDRDKGKTEADLKREDIAAASELVISLKLGCAVADAQLAAQGKTDASGKPAQMNAYEVACGNGLGYFVVSQAPSAPYAISCFTAKARHDMDAAKGPTSDAECRLPANADVNAAAGAVLARAGAPCMVDKLAWMGQSDTTATEYDEAACHDGTGYVLATALAGSMAPPRAVACKDAAAEGLPCTLTEVAAPAATITLQTFKDALAEHHVACSASGEHVIGQQNKSKRYVVEFKCAEQPAGLVAFIPLAGNTAPFETVDCTKAAALGAKCTLQ